ncbi:hypothetical protein FRC11_008916 [Ceratobasidium sp. 423]|nr:hypothetical protein FRC11_008916 [Ceratobasidium sp. 423]
MPNQPHHAGVLKQVDKDLPPVVHGNLADFQRKYKELAAMHHLLESDLGPHSSFALTGIYQNEADTQYQMKVQAADRDVQGFRLKQYDDIDSVIGFVHHGDPFPLKPDNTLFYCMFNNINITLKTSLHLPPYSFTGQDGTVVGLEYHHIPNAICGHLGGANVQKILIRFFFPGLAGEREAFKGNIIDAKLMKVFYEKAVCPAVLRTIPQESRHEWALDFSTEQFRAGTSSGSVVYTPCSVVQEVVDAFFEAIHQFCQDTSELKWARGFFLQIQIQGSKSSTKHSKHAPQDGEIVLDEEGDDPVEAEFEDSRTKATTKAPDPLDWELFNLEHWVIDIATTFHYMDAGFSLLPRVETHHLVLSTLTGINSTEATTLVTRGSCTGYYADEIAHLGSSAGLRVEMLKGPFISPLSVLYAQVYASGDKDLTSLKDRNRVAKHVEPQFMFSDFDHVMGTFFSPLLAVFQTALDEDQTVDVCIESRVPFEEATTAHRWFDPSQFAGYMVKVKTKDYWHWKIIRLESIIAALSKMHPALPDVPRMKLNPAATLGVGLCYMANALVNRPEVGPEFQALADTLSVHEIKQGVLVAIRPLIAFFLHSLFLEESCPRISMARVLDLPQIAWLCQVSGDPTGSGVAGLIKQDKVCRREEPALAQWGQEPGVEQPLPTSSTPTNSSGVGSVSRSKCNKLAMGYDEQDSVFGPNDNVPEPPTVAPFAEEEDDPEEAPQVLTNRAVLNEIFHRMAGEMLLKVPDEGQTKLSWQSGSDNDCHSMQFQDLCNSKTIDQMMRGYRMTTDAGIWEQAVKKILPTGEELRKIKYKAGSDTPKPRFLQGLAQCYFFQQWSALVENRDNSLTAKQLEGLVTVARTKLNEKAQWLPVGKPDRLWADVGAKNAKIHGTQINGKEPPVVVLNPMFPRDPNVPGGY